MNDLINHIDCQIAECLGRGKFYGLAKLIMDDKGQFYPSVDKEQGEKITANDKYPILIYHRLLAGSGENDEVYSFGRHASKKVAQTVRMVVVVDVKEGMEVIEKIIDALPDAIINENYRFAEVGSTISLDNNSQAVWETEWSEAYKKYQMRYRLYAVEYQIEYIKCSDCVAAD